MTSRRHIYQMDSSLSHKFLVRKNYLCQKDYQKLNNYKIIAINKSISSHFRLKAVT